MMMIVMIMAMRMMAMAAALLARGIGLGIEPAPRIERFGLRIIEAGIEEPRRSGFAALGGEDTCGWIEGAQASDQRMESILALASGEEVELRQHQAVGDCRLLYRFRMGIERR